MIGKPEWFTYRILGWGVRPRTKEGWMYTLIAIAVVVGIGYLPILELYRTIAIGIVTAVIVVDILHIMTQLSKVHDEREKKNQLVIERNVSFVAVCALVLVAVYQSIKLGTVDVSVIFVLAAMVLAKAGSWLWLHFKG